MYQRYSYAKKPVEKGYAGRTLHIDLSNLRIEEKPVSEEMKTKFIGGRGFCLYLMWHALPWNKKVKWDMPENCLCIASGPLGGTTVYPGSGKSIVTTISPLTGAVVDSNVGGYFGPYLKFAGFDALCIQGKAEKECVIYINGDEGYVEIVEASGLPEDTHLLAEELTAKYGGQNKKSVSVVSSGSAAKHILYGCLNFSWYDTVLNRVRVKQAGRGGTGTVLRNKNILAIVVKCSNVSVHSNNPADMKTLLETARYHSSEIIALDPKQNQMREIGTTHLVSIMNDFDLLPVHNFQYGSHPEAKKLYAEEFRKYFGKNRNNDSCWIGCALSCSHHVNNFVPKTGKYAGQAVLVDGPEYETIAGIGSNCGIFDIEAVIEGNFYCDTYGVDTISFGTSLAFAMECYERGLINKEITGGIELKFGNKDAMLEILHQMSRGEGFGKILGMGVRRMKEYFAKFGADRKLMQDIGMEVKGLEYSEYVTKESLAQQGGYGLALKGPQHDEAWLIFLDMVKKLMPTFEQKAEALYWFPMWRTWFGLNGLCKLPWNDVVPEDNAQTKEPAKVMKHVESYARYFSAVTGRKVGPDDLIKMSEVVYNFQRIFNLRLGFGTRKDDMPPYRSMGPVTKEEYESRQERYDRQLQELGYKVENMSTEEKIKALRKHREDQYQKLCDAVYARRGWTKDGVPSMRKVKELGIDYPEVIKLLRRRRK
ncbi:MAG: aldehyde ferredoxin oxidoreductase C-terminal domain-containing protein [Thermoplasmata archaeon]